MKTIFLLTNFTATSINAHKNFMRVYGSKLKDDYRFVLINAWRQPRTGHFQMINLDDYLEETSGLDLQKEKESLKKQFIDKAPSIETMSVKGDIVDVVNQLAVTSNPDLIVIGTKGSNLLREIIVGSTTGRIIRNIKLPTFIIPESVYLAEPYRVIFASDLQECRNKRDFEKLTNLVRKFMAELLVLHIYKDEKPDVSRFETCMEPYLEGINYSFHYKQHVDIETAIMEFAELMKGSLLAMIGKKDDIIVKLFKRSITNDITLQAELPLLIIHE